MFAIPKNWFTQNAKTATLISQAAHQIEGHIAPNPSWTQGQDPGESNKALRTWSAANRRNFIIFRLLSEVHKSVQAVPSWGKAIKNFGDIQTSRVAVQRLGNEQHLRQRNLVEAVILAINFADMANRDIYMQHLSLLKDLEFVLRKRAELRDNFGVANFAGTPSLQQRRDSLITEINTLEVNANFSIGNCWYLKSVNNNNNLPKTLNQRIQGAQQAGREDPGTPDYVETSGLLDALFANAQRNSPLNQLENSMLGFTYQNVFGASSQDIHFGSSIYLPHYLETILFQQATIRVLLLAAIITIRCFQIIGKPAELTTAAKLDATFTGPGNQPIYQDAVTTIGQPGDFLYGGSFERLLVLGRIAAHSNNARYVAYDVEDFHNGGSHEWVPASDVFYFFPSITFNDLSDRLNENAGFTRQQNQTAEEFVKSCLILDRELATEIALENGHALYAAGTMRFAMDPQ